MYNLEAESEAPEAALRINSLPHRCFVLTGVVDVKFATSSHVLETRQYSPEVPEVPEVQFGFIVWTKTNTRSALPGLARHKILLLKIMSKGRM